MSTPRLEWTNVTKKFKDWRWRGDIEAKEAEEKQNREKAHFESQHDEAEQQEYHKGELQDGERNDDEDRLLQPDDNVEGEQLPTYDFS